jgi:hypothetical protein
MRMHIADCQLTGSRLDVAWLLLTLPLAYNLCNVVKVLAPLLKDRDLMGD